MARIIASSERMLEKRNLVPAGRDAGVTQPRFSRGLIQDLSRRKLQSAMTAHVMCHRQFRTVRRPVGILNVIEQFAGRTAGERHESQRALTANLAEMLIQSEERRVGKECRSR